MLRRFGDQLGTKAWIVRGKKRGTKAGGNWVPYLKRGKNHAGAFKKKGREETERRPPKTSPRRSGAFQKNDLLHSKSRNRIGKQGRKGRTLGRKG